MENIDLKLNIAGRTFRIDKVVAEGLGNKLITMSKSSGQVSVDADKSIREAAEEEGSTYDWVSLRDFLQGHRYVHKHVCVGGRGSLGGQGVRAVHRDALRL